eukprot:CAMPEP_0202101564 /NCGR_PEP_ID=MMETSP0965-20130614/3808_1 /ASSEMBLY_ACC=CAM_ASM_000507 /TAXON_ID=4773 /ORGANISM="Schizochytrium aggregatum, Strain ATCC28209" /LENGTH=307 /DNA_ID=CAMNT_0048670283 /DNA_START=384 /DNA_END=1306 /DNA_ORIENTATION=-
MSTSIKEKPNHKVRCVPSVRKGSSVLMAIQNIYPAAPKVQLVVNFVADSPSCGTNSQYGKVLPMHLGVADTTAPSNGQESGSSSLDHERYHEGGIVIRMQRQLEISCGVKDAAAGGRGGRASGCGGGGGAREARCRDARARGCEGSVMNFVAREEILRVLHRLELERVAGRVLEEHGPLLTWKALEAQVRLDHELGVDLLEAGCEFVELGLGQHDAKVRHGHLVRVHWVEVAGGAVVRADVVANDLVAKEAVVNPLAGRLAALEAAQDGPVERAGCIEVVHREGEVEGPEALGHLRLAGAQVRAEAR